MVLSIGGNIMVLYLLIILAIIGVFSILPPVYRDGEWEEYDHLSQRGKG